MLENNELQDKLYLAYIAQNSVQSFVNTLFIEIHMLKPAADDDNGANSDGAESLTKYALGMFVNLKDKTISQDSMDVLNGPKDAPKVLLDLVIVGILPTMVRSFSHRLITVGPIRYFKRINFRKSGIRPPKSNLYDL